jgi:outer membrane protein TolC
MNKIKGIFLFLFFFNLLLFSREITLKEAIDLTFENNPTLKTKLNDFKSAEYSYYISLNSYYPRVSLSHGFSRSGGERRTPSNSFSASISLSQSLFDYGSIISIQTAKLNYEIAELQLKSYLIELRKNLYTSFYNLYFASKLVEVVEKIVDIRKSNADLITLKYESGMESKGNMLYAKAQYEMAKLNLEKSKRDLETASNALKSIIGISSDDILIARVDELKEIDSVNFNLNEIDNLIKINPNYKIYEKNIEISKMKLENAKLDWLPKLSFSASKSYSGDREFPDRESWSLGISMSLPIFSSGITYRKNNVLSLEKSLESSEEKLRDYYINLKEQIKSVYLDLLNAIDTLKTYKILLSANEERYQESLIKYMAGKMSYVDLENMEQNLIDSKQSYINYLKNIYLKKINLDYLLSEKLEKI